MPCSAQTRASRLVSRRRPAGSLSHLPSIAAIFEDTHSIIRSVTETGHVRLAPLAAFSVETKAIGQQAGRDHTTTAFGSHTQAHH